MKRTLISTLLLSVSVTAFAQDIPSIKDAASDPLTSTAEFALRDQCRDLAKKVVGGFKKARLGEAAPADEAELAGFELPADTDIASQALRLQRECVRANVGNTSPTWAAAEVMAQARATGAAALRCIGAGLTYAEPVLEAELELAQCHRAEYPGLPAVAGGKHWTIQKGASSAGLTLDVTARLGGPQASLICGFINDLSRGPEDATCRIRDDYSQVSYQVVVREANALPGDLNQAIRTMVEEYRAQMQGKSDNPAAADQ